MKTLKKNTLSFYCFFEKFRGKGSLNNVGYFKGEIYEYYRKDNSLVGFHKNEYKNINIKRFYIQ